MPNRPPVFGDAVRGIIFDLDGTVMRGGEALPGANAIIAHLKRTKRPFVFCTQDTENDDATNAARLNRVGFGITAEQIVSGGKVAADYLKSRHGDQPIQVIGTERQVKLFASHGIRIARPDQPSPAVFVGLYPGFSANDLETACRLVFDGLEFLGPCRDRTVPMAAGLVPSTGPFLRAIEHVTRRRAKSLGKPSATMAKAALARLQLSAEQILVIGDNVEIDIRMGKNIGARTALVLTGATSLATLKRIPARLRPDLVLDGVGDLIAYL